MLCGKCADAMLENWPEQHRLVEPPRGRNRDGNYAVASHVRASASGNGNNAAASHVRASVFGDGNNAAASHARASASLETLDSAPRSMIRRQSSVENIEPGEDLERAEEVAGEDTSDSARPGLIRRRNSVDSFHSIQSDDDMRSIGEDTDGEEDGDNRDLGFDDDLWHDDAEDWGDEGWADDQGADDDDVTPRYNLGDVANELDDDDFDPTGLPFTDSTAECPEILWGDRSRKNGYSSISCRVMFNIHGRCHTHRNQKLVGSKGESGFLERIVSTCAGKSVPLLFCEAAMYTTIFWSGSNGNCLGSLPITLWAANSIALRDGFAGVTDQLLCRVRNPELQCHTDPRYLFHAFDVHQNLNLSGFDSRFLFKRGYEATPGGRRGISSQTGIGNDDGLFPGDTYDSRKNLSMVAGMIREKLPHFFYTQTCNQKDHYGVAQIHEWIESRCKDYMNDYSITFLQRHEKCQSLREAGAFAKVTTWMRAGEMLMDYIITSDEQPLGPIDMYWWRWEFQDVSTATQKYIGCMSDALLLFLICFVSFYFVSISHTVG